MRNNILGGLVIFFVVVTCLLMIDDISSTNEVQTTYKKIEVEQVEKPSELATLDEEQ
ncbi:hypothetical protein H8K90_06615 [Winogradskyella echinorum]|uniref:Uncharacterized protein n=1 Tax=Winogradskyella echinorum TaxID=538189 RepID=A0ABR6XZX5_9FLAO|nr:hypothetical protein [Winogradskyella echinorum]MBC3846043.1 hypothetical protein [Winogradskyella echinorum]MBC5750391.1 hypothetical protein [Winogradskyella echinorum]